MSETWIFAAPGVVSKEASMKAVMVVEFLVTEEMGAEEAVTNINSVAAVKPMPVTVTGVVGEPAGAELGVTLTSTGKIAK